MVVPQQQAPWDTFVTWLYNFFLGVKIILHLCYRQLIFLLVGCMAQPQT